ncbi:MAG: tryptophan synthase subunit alpha, partial [Pseudomonadota bacterium]|nr:tryptophan synthase subunit alpha [Pseudomonadota bacterium]
MSRITQTFLRLQEQHKKALIPFITSGDPSPELTAPLMHAMVKAGADVIELGVPFSDPMADGPAIQRSSERAIKQGVGLRQVLGYVAEFRKTDDSSPVVLMGYANPIEHMGYEAFAKTARAS